MTYSKNRYQSNNQEDGWSPYGKESSSNPRKTPEQTSAYGPIRGSKGYYDNDSYSSNSKQTSTLGSKLKEQNWSTIELQPFKKNFYHELSSVSQMTDDEVNEWRKENFIGVKGNNVPKPIRTFEEAGFPEYIMKEIRKAGFEKPTPIQAQGWPMALSGYDVIGIAQTGSGKTLAYLLPSIIHINAQPHLGPNDGPIILIIVPTRELAIQIENECDKFIKLNIKYCSIYGGVNRKEQTRKLNFGIHICICTPGRLIDFIENNTTNLYRVTYLVIDEADRLLDMGFKPQLEAILSQIRNDRQILMWSATWPIEVQNLAKNYLNYNDCIQVTIGHQHSNHSLNSYSNHHHHHEVLVANQNIQQIIHVLKNSYQKNDQLYEIITKHLNNSEHENEDKNNEKENNKKILIFTSTKRMCSNLSYNLEEEWYVSSLHGDKQQREREQALNNFKNGYTPIMVATDVASRGIHVDDITLVINYDFPSSLEDYVHRIGRTGRCGKKGVAISFITDNDVKCIPKLIELLKQSNQEIPQELNDLSYHGLRSSYNKYNRSRW